MSAPADDLTLALEIVDLADGVTLERFGALDLKVETKPDLTPVSEADTAVEEAIRRRLAQARPDDAVVGEEYGSSGAGAARRWIIDPIDATKNYVRGIPVWATLLALELDGEPVLGVVSAPALGRRWWAARGEGAFCAERLTGETRQLRVSSIAALADAQLAISGLEDWLEPAGRMDALLALVAETSRTRGFGDFWAYMLLAEGGVDIALDSPGVSLWDLAAPQVIVEEAGGRFTDLAGTRTVASGEAIASNGRLHDAALAIVGR